MANERFKFRCYNTLLKRYVNNLRVYSGPGERGFVIPLKITSCYIIEQSVGICDKNGNLIYEGDIVCDRGEINPVCNLPLVVKWSDRLCCFMFDNEKIGMRTSLSSIDGAESHNYEIVGNIHENGGENGK